MANTVFLSYNREDAPAVEQIAERLKRELSKVDAQVWLDKWDLRPGLPWQAEAGQALRDSYAVVVFVGPSAGGWQEREIQDALSEQVNRKIPVIPLLLPDTVRESVVKFPFLRENMWIDLSKDINDRSEFERLLWGITGQRRFAERESPQPHSDNAAEANDGSNTKARARDRDDTNVVVDEAADTLFDWIKDGFYPTYFLGTGAAQGQGAVDPDLPPRINELTRELLTDLHLIREDAESCPLAAVDTAGLYYASKKDAPRLERKVKMLIMNRSKKIPPTYVNLVRLLAIGQVMRPQFRGDAEPNQLIVTTNFDLLLECALIRARLRFVRIVQDRSGREIHVDEFTEGLPVSLDPSDLDSVPDRIQEKLDPTNIDTLMSSHRAGKKAGIFVTNGAPKKNEHPIEDFTINRVGEHNSPTILLYKLHGSLDILNSCAISTDDYFRLQRRITIPEMITELISNTPSVFLGYGPMDPDLHLTYEMIRDEFEDNVTIARYAVPLSPLGNEKKHWGDVSKTQFKRMNMTVLDSSSETFLDKLIAHFGTQQSAR